MQFPAEKPLRKVLCTLMAVLVASPATPVQNMPNMQDCSGVLSGSAPLIIGHRGAPGHLPENTLASYRLAIALGADFIETDMVSTRDGVLIARHEPNLLHTTDVAWHPEFASRRRTMVVSGVPEEGFFASDFTLAEIRTLSAVQASNGAGRTAGYRVPTLEEILQLAQRESRSTGRRIGLYVETKHPSWHQSLGLPLEDKLLAALKHAGYDHADSPVFVESFEPASLKYLHARSPLPMIQLIHDGGVDDQGNPQLRAPNDKPYDFAVAHDSRTYADMLTPQGLHEVARYAAGVGVSKSWLLPARCPFLRGGCFDSDRKLLSPTQVVRDAHAVGLVVHPFTFRSDPGRLAQDYQEDPVREYQKFFALGVDGVITDDADAARLARASCLIARR